jgi:hypothetical protein
MAMKEITHKSLKDKNKTFFWQRKDYEAGYQYVLLLNS